VIPRTGGETMKAMLFLAALMPLAFSPANQY
jgi:hypothetical protein